MKRFLFALALLATAAPLFANDDGGDGPVIPDYQTLVREGYGPRHDVIRLYPILQAAPKPTQAYYTKGYTIYYGYTAVPMRRGELSALYAFGYPVEYFKQMMPTSVSETNLERYAVELPNSQYTGDYSPGNFVARAQAAQRPNAVTTVTRTTTTTTTNGTNPLPAIGEKPAQ
jgi:hypothetical protein